MSAAASKKNTKTAAYDWRLIKRLWRYISPHQRLIWFGLALLLIISGCRLALPFLIKVAIDEHIKKGLMDGFSTLVGAYLFVILLEFVLRRTQIYAVDKAGQDGLFDLRIALFRHLQRLPARFHDRRWLTVNGSWWFDSRTGPGGRQAAA